MNLDELRTVQSKERSKDSLQHLRESFYADVADYVEDLRDRRDRAAESADNPFDDSEVNRLTDEIHTAEDVVEAVYERRVGKVVKRASLAAAGMPADEEGLTSEEQELFAELVDRIEANKESVLEILAGEDADEADSESASADPSGSAQTASVSEPADSPASSETGETSASDGPGASASDGVSAADAMGGDRSGDSASGVGSETGEESPDRGPSDDGAGPTATEGAPVAGASDQSSADRSEDSDDSSDLSSSVSDADDDPDDLLGELAERTTIRITSDVGEIFGVDERTYELASEDVVTLPEANAEPLVERGAAEKLE